jgi:SAM-dependent methyltransferase
MAFVDKTATVASTTASGELSHLDASLAVGKSIARSVGRLIVRRVQRDRGKVDAEYHSGHWARVLNDRAWEKAPDLGGFLTRRNDSQIVAQIDGRARKMTSEDYYRYRLQALADLVRRNLGEQSRLVELGCGFGYNLFALSLAFPDREFRGFDLSANAVEAARQIARHFGLSARMRFDVMDLTDGSAAGLAELEGNDVLTYMCLEQIPYDIRRVVENILSGRPRRVLHVEPTNEMIEWSKPLDWASYVYLKSVDYQTELFRVLEQMSAAGELKLEEVGRVGFSPTVHNQSFFARWSSV